MISPEIPRVFNQWCDEGQVREEGRQHSFPLSNWDVYLLAGLSPVSISSASLHIS